MNTNHLVVGRIERQRFRLGVYPSYEAALTAWMQLDAALRAGRLAILAGGNPRYPSARRIAFSDGTYLAVRASDDPQWAKAEKLSVVMLRRGAGLRALDPAVKKLGIEEGVHGHSGGWLYRGGPGGNANHHRPGAKGCHRLPYQGWTSWWWNKAATRPASIVLIGHRYHLVEQLAKGVPATADPGSLAGRLLDIACDDCHRTDGTHDLSIEH